MRVDYQAQFPEGVEALAMLEAALHTSPLEPALLELVRIRASQINGCAYCLAMHTRDARARGEHQVRLDTVAAWRETPFFTERERAALAWCESLTDLAHAGAPDGVFANVEAVFSAREAAALTFAVVAINSWNRLAVGLGADVTSLDGIETPLTAGASRAGVDGMDER
ncbi:carboxymuconolactone decarboxylase family protein [soil metagenome]